ncbi:MAG TPA: tetratricopeptide repeat protein, partial [Planctomycetaceae bacterium]|nr:tetratricopeptide repeat protein [Planctomycetaceae bacterium]
EYAAARATVEDGLKRYSSSVRLRLVGREACLFTGDEARAQELLEQIDQLATRSPWRYSDAADLVVLGEAALVFGADARDVLDGFFERARRLEPDSPEPWLACGRLALSKSDDELATGYFEEALKHAANHADAYFGLARAYARSSSERSAAALDAALKANPRHVPSLLVQVESRIDAEDFEGGDERIDAVLAINPRQPEAWAYRAVLAHLRNDPKGEAACRDAALANWKSNPAVDHLIGRKLSQNYRFAEGAAYQQAALAFDPQYVPARVQLSQDLLRLGREDEGWQTADAAFANDGYNVQTFNLLELRDELAKFRTLEDEHFIVRMDAREAEVYGERVLALLERARAKLCRKYELELDGKITVEIFPDPNDFAVRTFGMPAVSGYLGVCFGKVITANSPASQAEHPSNWEAVLWHEFCHVVTLELTRNRMPRWLSEGISVYEELQENPTWGQRMTPRYRRMILDGELTPVGKLSSAFLSPKSPFHVQFAYFESALVVEYLVNRYGLEALKRILRDLGAGLPINTALGRHTDGLEQLERDFDRFARNRAELLAPEVDWESPELDALAHSDGDALARWVDEHPLNFAGLSAYATQLVEERRWDEAKEPLSRLLKLYPDHTGAGNAYELLARAHRELNETAAERRVLEDYVARNASALAAGLRLLELQGADGDWLAVSETTGGLLAINPLLPGIHRELAAAAERLARPDDAIAAYRALLVLGPQNPAEVNFRLARLLRERNDLPAAKRHVLAALEDAPRYRDAHRLLLEIVRHGAMTNDETRMSKE